MYASSPSLALEKRALRAPLVGSAAQPQLATAHIAGQAWLPWRTLAATLAYCCRAAAPSSADASCALKQRCRLRDVDGVAALLKDGAKCVVMLGAGASVAAGLPDFRTPGTGLYDTLEISGLPYPEAVFELGFFTRTRSRSTSWQHGPDASKPTKAHKLVKLLADKDQLVRCYTQNIDSLESSRVCGVRVAAHGNFDSAACIAGRKVDAGTKESMKERRTPSTPERRTVQGRHCGSGALPVGSGHH